MFKKNLFLTLVIVVNFITLNHAYNPEHFSIVEWGSDVKKFEGLDLSKADLSRFDFFQKHFIDANLDEATLKRCTEIHFLNCTLNDAILEGAQLQSACFWDCELNNTNFENADCEGTFFINCKFNGTFFCGANLKLATFINCEFINVKFNGSNYRKALFDEKVVTEFNSR
jgi:uncharacterized protein YjbI with pentapeptide repeats